jgi:hypothetical protein
VLPARDLLQAGTDQAQHGLVHQFRRLHHAAQAVAQHKGAGDPTQLVIVPRQELRGRLAGRFIGCDLGCGHGSTEWLWRNLRKSHASVRNRDVGC